MSSVYFSIFSKVSDALRFVSSSPNPTLRNLISNKVLVLYKISKLRYYLGLKEG